MLMARMDAGYINLRLGIAQLYKNSVIELSIFIFESTYNQTKVRNKNSKDLFWIVKLKAFVES